MLPIQHSPLSFAWFSVAILLHHRPMKHSLVLALLIAVSNRASASTNDIHSVDFKNFHYRPSCLHFGDKPAEVEHWQLSGTGESVVVTNGVLQKNNPDDYLDFRVCKITYGKPKNFSNDVAIVITICDTGGSGSFSDGFIYGMANGQPKLIAVIQGGDRAYGAIHSATIENGLLRVERYGTNFGACCPRWIETRNYKLLNGRLVEIGMGRRRKYVEPTCLSEV